MQERRRLTWDLELRFELVPAIPDCDQLVLHVSAPDTFDDRLDDLLAPRFQLNQLALRRRLARALLHPEPVHLLRKLAAELLEEVLAHQLVLKRPQHAFLNFLTRDRQLVGAGAAVTRAEASELVARVDDEAGTAFAAFRQAREEILRPAELVEALARLRRLPLPLHTGVSRLHGLPQLIVQDPQLGHVLGDPLRPRIRSCDTPTGVRILQESLAVPDHAPDVQLVAQDADAARRVAVNRARVPQGATGAAQSVPVQVLRDLLGRQSSGVVFEDSSDDLCFLRHDLAFAGGHHAVFKSMDDPVAVTHAAAGLAKLDPPAQSASSLVRQLLQEHRVHRPLEADVQERDVTLCERDDADAGERQALEQAGRVFLVAAESIERFRQYDIDFLPERRCHHRLEP